MIKDLKVRVISALVALAIVIPILLLGGIYYYVGVSVIGLIGFYEIINIREKQKKIPALMKVLSTLCFLFFLIVSFDYNSFSIDYKVLTTLLVVMLTPLLIYGKNKEYDINDAFYLISSILLLGIAFRYLLVYRNMSIHYIFYLLMITIMTDTFAHFFGSKLGKNKLCPYVSPNKTIEGLIGGTFFGTYIGTLYYLTFINMSANTVIVILLSLILSLIAQVGDLIFSAFKRKYDVKDFGNIMPGHGGVLDRLDSLILAMLAFSILMSLLSL